MILSKLVVENYGLFRGRNVFALEPTSKRANSRPIILFGGMNGSGKTTLLEAVRLAFYGPSALGVRVGQGEYAKLLSNRIHYSLNGDLPVNQASVELEFKHVHAGVTNTYTIERSWTRSTKNADSLALYCNEQLILEPGPEQWQEFLKELLPPGLSQLYFFDAEKIEALADASSRTAELSDSFKSLIGLDVVERLQSDLTIFLARQAGNAKSDALSVKFNALKKAKEAAETERAHRVQDKAHIQTQVSALKAKIERLEQQIVAEGGIYGERRQDAMLGQKQLQLEIEQTESAIRELCSDLLPFVLVMPLMRQLSAQLRLETDYQRATVAYAAVAGASQYVADRMANAAFWDGLCLPTVSQLRVASLVHSALLEAASQNRPPENTIIHNLSGAETNRLLDWITRSETVIPSRLLGYIQQLEKLHADLHECTRTLQAVPSEENLKPLLVQFQETAQALARQEQLLAQADASLQDTLRALGDIERQLDQVGETLKQQSRGERRDEMARRTLRLLDDYKEAATRLKIQNLQQAFAESFNQLAHKREFITSAQIDPRTFAVTLTTGKGQRVPQSNLSAGEKQIYAIAMLWALRKVSGRPLPVIIDTPLGRLDSDHRQRLVSHYFPSASHQVILLSTDTEIDQRYFEDLRPNISRTYHLEYDRKHGHTEVTEGYFWGKNGGARHET